MRVCARDQRRAHCANCVCNEPSDADNSIEVAKGLGERCDMSLWQGGKMRHCELHEGFGRLAGERQQA